MCRSVNCFFTIANETVDAGCDSEDVEGDLDQSLLDTADDGAFSDKDAALSPRDDFDDDDDVDSRSSITARRTMLTPGGYPSHQLASSFPGPLPVKPESMCAIRTGGGGLSPGCGVGLSPAVGATAAICCAVKNERLNDDSNCSVETKDAVKVRH